MGAISDFLAVTPAGRAIFAAGDAEITQATAQGTLAEAHAA